MTSRNKDPLRNKDPFNTRSSFDTGTGMATIYRLKALEESGVAAVSRLPRSIRVLLEAALRQYDGFEVREEDIRNIASWSPETAGTVDIPFKPARVILQDFTGVPSVVDLAAMRDAMARMGGDPKKVNPQVPVDLVIDHSVQVDAYGSPEALETNSLIEFQRNRERYEFLRWGKEAFSDFRVVPPATGIVHQVNLEYLATVVQQRPHPDGSGPVCFPDSLVGTDSHTTMINGLGVVGWGVGGIEAEAVMMGQPIYMRLPEVIGFKLLGALPAGATATDLVLTITEQLRKVGVVGKFVEFFGSGLAKLPLADRATIANMAPEYGATMGFMPVDEETIRYLERTARPAEVVARVRAYMTEQGLLVTPNDPDPVFCHTVELDMGTIVPSLAGPKRPQDRIALSNMKRKFYQDLTGTFGRKIKLGETADSLWTAPEEPSSKGDRRAARSDLYEKHAVAVEMKGQSALLSHGSLAIAAITSCTNTSNPGVIVAAGLLARKAVQKGLSVSSLVKTSLAPGSRVVTRYLEAADLMKDLESLGFHVVGYGCTTCIGNSGPLADPIVEAIQKNEFVVTSVLSGNRNFEGRVSPHTRANYLASPPLVVAYALAGTVDIDFEVEPIGNDKQGNPVYLKDLWPSQEEVLEVISNRLTPEMFASEYGNVFECNETWNAIDVPEGERFTWDESSTYVREPTFFEGLTQEVPPIQPIKNARCLALLGDSVTTDHISPAGSIAKDSPAARYLVEHGVEPKDFNSYGSRRGNHEVMMRGTFANIRIRNEMIPGVEGGLTRHVGSNQQMSIFDAAMKYRDEEIPLIIIAGKEYGTGSSRDWAGKGPYLQGVRAVIAESYERIHRSNLIGMGIVPLQFSEGESRKTLGLTGYETYTIDGIDDGIDAQQELTVHATPKEGPVKSFKVLTRIDTAVEVNYVKHGGILQMVLRRMARE